MACGVLGGLLYRIGLKTWRSPVMMVIDILLPAGLVCLLFAFKGMMSDRTTGEHKYGQEFLQCPPGYYGSFPEGVYTTEDQLDFMNAYFCQDQAEGRPPFMPSRTYTGETILYSMLGPSEDNKLYFQGDDCGELKEFYDGLYGALLPQPEDPRTSTIPTPPFALRDGTTELGAPSNIFEQNSVSPVFAVFDCKHIEGGTVEVDIRVDPLTSPIPDTRYSPYLYGGQLRAYQGVDSAAYLGFHSEARWRHPETFAGTFIDLQAIVSSFYMAKNGLISPTTTTTLTPFDSFMLDRLSNSTVLLGTVTEDVYTELIGLSTAGCLLCYENVPWNTAGAMTGPAPVCAALDAHFAGDTEWADLKSTGECSEDSITSFVDHLSEDGFRGMSVHRTAMGTPFREWITTNALPIIKPYVPFSFFEAAMPTEDYEVDRYILSLIDSTTVGDVWAFAFLVVVYRITTSLMEDKELRLKEFLRIAGASEMMQFLAWWLFYLMYFAVFSLVMSLLLSLLVPHASFGLLYFLVLLYCLVLFSYCVLVSSLFQKSSVAGVVACVVLMVLGFPYIIHYISSYMSQGGMRACLIFFPAAFLWGVQLIMSKEFGAPEEYVGFDWSDLGYSYDGVTLGGIYAFLIFDAVLYFAVGWYIYQLSPGEFGVSRPWYFLFTKDYWNEVCGKDAKEGEGAEYQPPEGKLFENQEGSDRMEVVTELRDLKKEFVVKGACGGVVESNIAVQGTSMQVYRGEIFALLGHNGAGKTTTISMLTGILPATDGEAYIMGHEIGKHTALARQHIGFCPQHDIIFPYMSVDEHLHMFGMIKGLNKQERQEEADVIVKQLQLEDKRDCKAGSLSGGQKRRVCVGIALTGGADAVFLDEPTSGMDPYSRRALWETLKLVKKDRSIILTTHFMEEADYLGDRIAIYAEGELVCLGSALFLKQELGVGYTLSITKTSDISVEQSRLLVDYLTSSIPKSEVLSDISKEISLRVPFEATPALPPILEEMETAGQVRGVESFALSVTTLEEVFLRVGADVDVAKVGAEDKLKKSFAESMSVLERKDSKAIIRSSSAAEGGDVFMRSEGHKVEGTELYMKRMGALWMKRAKGTISDTSGMLFTLGLPIFLFFFFLNIYQVVLRVVPNHTALVPSSYQDRINTDVIPQNIYFSTDGPSVPSTCPEDAILENSGASSLSGLEDFLLDLQFESDPPLSTAYHLRTPTDNYPLEFDMVHSSSYKHAIPVGINFLVNCHVQSESADAGELNLGSYPLNRTDSDILLITNGVIIYYAILALALVAGNWASAIVSERVSGVKHIQHLGGMTISQYWTTNAAWDLTWYLVPVVIIWVILEIYSHDSFRDGRRGPTLLLFLCFGPALCGLNYLISHATESPGVASGICIIMAIFLPLVMVILREIPDVIRLHRDWLRFILFFVPHIAVTDGVLNVMDNVYITDPWHIDNSGWPMIYLLIDGILFFGLAVIVDQFKTLNQETKRHLGMNTSSAKVYTPDGDEEPEEEDVKAEAERTKNSEDVIKILGLRKAFPGQKKGCCGTGCCASGCCGRHDDIVAVENLTYGVPAGEVFGFLGVNGAGKTTTCKALTAHLVPTYGTATLSGHDVTTHTSRVWSVSGYCPQHDALTLSLTVEETIHFYGRLAGIEESYLNNEFIPEVLSVLGLQTYAKRQAGKLSGGNKRKLQLGVSLISNPEVLLLDEPTTGVDPAARRKLWSIVASTTQQGNRAVILTTHSMEECEALCNSMAVMKSGRLICHGSGPHLRQKFGQGYELQVTLKMTDEEVDHAITRRESSVQGSASRVSSAMTPLDGGEEETATSKAFREFIEEYVPGSKLMESIGTNQRWMLPKANVSISKLFRLMEDHKERLSVGAYGVSEATLESVFIYLQDQDE